MLDEGYTLIALSAVDQLLAIGTVSPPLLDAVIAFLDDGNKNDVDQAVDEFDGEQD